MKKSGSLVLSCFLVIVLSGCSSNRGLHLYEKTDRVSLVFNNEGKTSPNQIVFTNVALYNDVEGGAEFGITAGAAGPALFIGILCLPCLPMAVPLLFATAATGGVIGLAAGSAMGVATEWINDEDKQILVNKFSEYYKTNDPLEEFVSDVKKHTQDAFVIDETSTDNELSVSIQPGIDHVGDNKFSFTLSAIVVLKKMNQRTEKQKIVEDAIQYVGTPLTLKSWKEADDAFFQREVNYAYLSMAKRIESALSD